jgi:hypothetical protein
VNAYQNTLKGQANAFVTQLSSAGDALVYSTYLGGSQFDQGFGIAVDSAGSAYVVGLTDSGDFPTANALQPAHHDPSACWEIKCDDGYITKFSPDGQSLIYSTYLGGSNRDLAFSIALDSSNNAYITGSTSSSDFPTAHPYQAQLKSCKYMAVCDDAFVAKISTSGDSLLYSTYLGGNEPDRGLDITVDNQGNAYVVGFGSVNFPTTRLYPGSSPDTTSAFITKLAPSGSSFRYSIRIGDSSAVGVALDTSGHVYIAGTTLLKTFPLVKPIQSVLHGISDYFMMKIKTDGSQILFSTYWGGSEREDIPGGIRIAVDNIENLTVVGTTKSTDFPVYNPLQTTLAQYFDTTVTKIMTLPPEAMRGAPERNYFVTNDVTLTWSTIYWAKGYQIQISNNAQFTYLLKNDAQITPGTLSYAWTAPGSGKYYWHVRAKRANGLWSAWSIADSFYVASGS